MEPESVAQVVQDSGGGSEGAESSSQSPRGRRQPRYSIEAYIRSINGSLFAGINAAIKDVVKRSYNNVLSFPNTNLNRITMPDAEQIFQLEVQHDLLDSHQYHWEVEHPSLSNVRAPTDLIKFIHKHALFGKTSVIGETSSAPVIAILQEVLWIFHTSPDLMTETRDWTPDANNMPNLLLDKSGKLKPVGYMGVSDVIETLRRIRDSNACMALLDEFDEEYKTSTMRYLGHIDHGITVPTQYFGDSSPLYEMPAGERDGRNILIFIVIRAQKKDGIEEVVPALISNLAALQFGKMSRYRDGSDCRVYGAVTDGHKWQLYTISHGGKVMKSHIFDITKGDHELDKLFRALLYVVGRSLETAGSKRVQT
ncbi:hypothetical protein TWF696_007278 [Orbilia brochopaga]|uniref:Uncharacterized protein n=1 Tax=Orbilia brochopaga TaxID=3140254 RepID=A0AAV9UV09_9PEZI